MFVALLLAALGLSIQYNGHTYYLLISENTWTGAAAQARSAGGPTRVPLPTLAADELPFGPTSEADFPRGSAPPDAGCDEFLTTRELLCASLEPQAPKVVARPALGVYFSTWSW